MLYLIHVCIWFIYIYLLKYICLFSRFILYFECDLRILEPNWWWHKHVALYFQTILVMMGDYCTASVIISFEYAFDTSIRNVLPQIHKNRIISCWPCLSITNVSLCIFQTKQHKMISKVIFHIIDFQVFVIDHIQYCIIIMLCAAHNCYKYHYKTLIRKYISVVLVFLDC